MQTIARTRKLCTYPVSLSKDISVQDWSFDEFIIGVTFDPSKSARYNTPNKSSERKLPGHATTKYINRLSTSSSKV